MLCEFVSCWAPLTVILSLLWNGFGMPFPPFCSCFWHVPGHGLCLPQKCFLNSLQPWEQDGSRQMYIWMEQSPRWREETRKRAHGEQHQGRWSTFTVTLKRSHCPFRRSVRTRRVLWNHYKSSGLCSKSSVRNSQPGWMQLLTLVISLLATSSRVPGQPGLHLKQQLTLRAMDWRTHLIPDPACFFLDPAVQYTVGPCISLTVPMGFFCFSHSRSSYMQVHS